MNYVGSGKPFRRETPYVPSVSEPPPETRPRLERRLEANEKLEKEIVTHGRPKLQMLIDHLKERGPLNSHEVKALIGTDGTNLMRMITGTVVQQSVHRFGATQIRYVWLAGQEDALDKRLDTARSGGNEMPRLRWTVGDDGLVTLTQGSSTIKVSRADFEVINRVMGVM